MEKTYAEKLQKFLRDSKELEEKGEFIFQDWEEAAIGLIIRIGLKRIKLANHDKKISKKEEAEMLQQEIEKFMRETQCLVENLKDLPMEEEGA
jgi:hypothetical protein